MFGCITQLWAGGKSAALPFGKVSCRMMPAAVYSLEAAEWQKHSFLNVSKMEKQLVMMHNILFLFFFSYFLQIFRQLYWTMSWMLQKLARRFYLFKARVSSLSTKSKKLFHACLMLPNNKWLHTSSKTQVLYSVFLPAPMEMEEESFTWHHMN